MVRPIMSWPAPARYYPYQANPSNSGCDGPCSMARPRGSTKSDRRASGSGSSIAAWSPRLRVDQIETTQVVSLAQVDPSLAQNVVRRHDVEVEVGQLAPEQELLGLQTLALGVAQLAHRLGRRAREVLGAEGIQEC